MSDSIFTKIIKGDIPSHKVYEDDNAVAFLDIHPIHPGHTLVVPKKQVARIDQLPQEDFEHLWQITYQLIDSIKDVVKPHRVGVIVDGVDMPDHGHIHLVPLEETDSISAGNRTAADMNTEPDHTALADMAAKLRIT